MDPERVTVTIVSSAGEDAYLSVEDAMRQILDFFYLLATAGGEEASAISWQLVDVSMRSPLRATAVATPRFPGVQAEPIARREKARLAHSLDEIVHSARVPDWMIGEPLERAKSFLKRNANGIGRTEIRFFEGEPVFAIGERAALGAVGAIEATERTLHFEITGQPWSEIGTIEGNVKSTTSHYGNPAVIVRERSSGEDVVCVASPSAVEEGSRHTWAETWSNKRVLVTGEIIHRSDGRVARVNSANFEIVDSSPVSFNDIADPNFAGGLEPSEYLDSLWRDDIG